MWELPVGQGVLAQRSASSTGTLRGEVTLSPAAGAGCRSSYLSESLRVFNPRATHSSRAVYRAGSFKFI